MQSLNPRQPCLGKGSLSLGDSAPAYQTPARESEEGADKRRLTPPTCGAPGREGHMRWTEPLPSASLLRPPRASLVFGCPWQPFQIRILGSSSAKDVGLSRTNRKEKTRMTLPQGHISPDRLGPLCPRYQPHVPLFVTLKGT